jgi:hypothetical protein
MFRCRPSSHVGNKVVVPIISEPSVADCDPSPAVSIPCVVSSIKASRSHGSPRAVFGDCYAQDALFTNQPTFAPKAPTGTSPRQSTFCLSELLGRGDLCFATVALAQPSRVVLSGNTNTTDATDYGEFTNFVSSEIDHDAPPALVLVEGIRAGTPGGVVLFGPST